MLVLTRKLGQQIVLSINGVSATVEVLRVDGNRVRLGIAAPSEVAVKRSELVGNEAVQNKPTRGSFVAASAANSKSSPLNEKLSLRAASIANWID